MWQKYLEIKINIQLANCYVQKINNLISDVKIRRIVRLEVVCAVN